MEFIHKLATKIESEFCPSQLVVIMPKSVSELYWKGFLESFSKEPKAVIEIPDREDAKSITTYSKVVNKMAEYGVDRGDSILALGGGCTGDLAGFVAGTYKRGIDWIFVPTTLVSMIDSSIGGKTGINLAKGKNLLGVFHEAREVLRYNEFLETLSDIDMKSGFGEMIKYAVIAGEPLFSILQKQNDFIKKRAECTGYAFENMQEICIGIKRKFVEEDPFDREIRKTLNLGHTFGHAYEAYSNFEISHGEAVFLGILRAFDVSEMLGYDVGSDISKVKRLGEDSGIFDEKLKNFFERSKEKHEAQKIADIIRNDKKVSSSHIDFIVPKKIGECTIERLNLHELEGLK